MSQKPLLIVESPTKVKTIQQYLGNDYEVISCVGHVKDLPSKELGIDIENDFEIKLKQKPEPKEIPEPKEDIEIVVKKKPVKKKTAKKANSRLKNIGKGKK